MIGEREEYSAHSPPGRLWLSQARRLAVRFPWRWLALAAGAALLAWLVIDFGPARLAGELVQVGPGLLLLPAVFGLGSAVRAFGWRALLERADRPGAWATVASRFAASSLNDTLPLLGVGGEPTRLLWLPPARRTAGAPALVLDRVLLIVADALFVLVVALLALLFLAMPAALERQTFLAVGVALGLAGAVVLVTFRRGLAAPLLRLFSRLGVRSARRKLAWAEELDATVRTVWRERPGRVLTALGVQLFSRLLISAEVWVGLWLLGVSPGLLGALVISATPVAISVLFAFVPSQLGVQAAANALVFTALGLVPATGVALSLLQNVRQMILLPVGFVLLARAPRFSDPGGATGP